MGAGASLVSSSTRLSGSNGNKDRVAMRRPTCSVMSDHALRETLRQLQLSPETIAESVVALYAHARDPAGHPVEEDLARLCTSEYIRGALYTLASFLAVASALDSPVSKTVLGSSNSHDIATTTSHDVHRSHIATTTSHDVRRSTLGLNITGNRGDENDDPMRSGGTLLVETGDAMQANNSVTDKLATIWNRLRRTQSMPSTERALAVGASAKINAITLSPIELNGDDTEDDKNNASSSRAAACTREKRRNDDRRAASPPRLKVRVKTTPTSGPRQNLSAGFGFGSARSARGGDTSPPRRAPVRTGHWKLGHEIGKGSFGAVHIGLNEDSGDLIAVKVLSLQNADTAEQLYREIELMRQLTHPNIVCYLGAEVNDGDKTISIFQEWVPGSVTTLLVNFGPFSDRRIAGYTKQILQGLLYLHKERVIHRDIKGGNILIDDRGVVKLCDFGASKMLDTESVIGMGDHTRVGSPLFMAPEILLRREYGPQVDIWSLGGAVLEMATGQPPWHTLNLRTPVALINWVKRTEGPPPLPEGLSPLLTNFLLRCFQRDPNKRATAKQLLSDPFVAKYQGELAPPKVSTPGSDEESVSDIDNLSRSAAIERIRRASHSDFSARSTSASNSNNSPSSASDQSSATSRSPRSPHSPRAAATATANPVHGNGKIISSRQSEESNRIAVPPVRTLRAGQPASNNQDSGSMFPARTPKPAPLEAQQQQANGGINGVGGGGIGRDLGAGVAGQRQASPRAGGGNVSTPNRPSYPLPLQHGRGDAVAITALAIATAGLEPSTSASPSVAVGRTPRLTTPTRRQSGGGNRTGSASPNPFGGRRRSLDSPSPRSKAATLSTHAALPATVTGKKAEAEPSDQMHDHVGNGAERGRGGTEFRDTDETIIMGPDEGRAEVSSRGLDGARVRRGSCTFHKGGNSDMEGDSAEKIDATRGTAGGDPADSGEAVAQPDVTPGVTMSAGGVQVHGESARLKPRRSGRGERPCIGGGEVNTTSATTAAAVVAAGWR